MEVIVAMATKRRSTRNRKTSRARPRSYSELYKDDNSGVVKAPASSANPSQSAESGKSSVAVDWATEYAPVFGDLRTLVLVSAVIFVLMIGVGILM